MIKGKTTFVVGAGASCELNLPAGAKLATHISAVLRVDRGSAGLFANGAIRQALRADGVNLSRMLHLSYRADFVCSAMHLSPSIDTFLDAHQGDDDLVTLGKLGIAAAILEAEYGSHLYAYSEKQGNYYLDFNNANFKKSWYLSLWTLLVTGHTVDTIDRIFENVAFIIFNYDRCLEHFLYLSLQQYFGVSPDVAAGIVARINIVHPYGQTGSLPWQSVGVSVDFGSVGQTALNAFASELQTFTEAVDSGRADRIKAAIQGSQTVVFLGYGYLEQNNRLLTPPANSNATRVFATTYTLSAYDGDVARDDLVKILRSSDMNLMTNPINLMVEASPCAQMMRAHQLRLQRD